MIMEALTSMPGKVSTVNCLSYNLVVVLHSCPFGRAESGTSLLEH